VKRLFLVALFTAAVRADDVETWNTLDASLLRRGALDLTLHSQFRTRGGLSDFYQFRVGPQARVQVLPRLNLGGGYWYREGQSAPGRWDDQQRVFGGGELTFVSSRADFRARTYVERFFGGSVPGFTRYRQRAIVAATEGRVSPFCSIEFFFLQSGWANTRPGGGVRTRISPHVRLELAYYYDKPRTHIVPARHILFTGLQLEFGSR
jgi:hypothetical protein